MPLGIMDYINNTNENSDNSLKKFAILLWGKRYNIWSKMHFILETTVIMNEKVSLFGFLIYLCDVA